MYSYFNMQFSRYIFSDTVHLSFTWMSFVLIVSMSFELIASRVFFLSAKTLVGLSGLEPPTSRLSGVRSNRLSYKPVHISYWLLIGPLVCPRTSTISMYESLSRLLLYRNSRVLRKL